jgi:hypothetical protein
MQCCIPYMSEDDDGFDYAQPLSSQANPAITITLLCCARIELRSAVFFLIPIVWFLLMLICIAYGPSAALQFSCLQVSARRLRHMSII